MIALWSRFVQLEIAGDGGGQASSRAWPAVESAADRMTTQDVLTRPRSWMWLFVKKELRLQQLTLAISGLYVLACGVVMIAQRVDPLYVGPTFETLTGLHGVFIALVAGSLSSAEERQMGTLTPHVLLPQAAWRQWSVKVAATAGLTCALAFGLPMLLMLIFRPADPFIMEDEFVAGILLVVCAAMYVSSLCAQWIVGPAGDVPRTRSRDWRRGHVPSNVAHHVLVMVPERLGAVQRGVARRAGDGQRRGLGGSPGENALDIHVRGQRSNGSCGWAGPAGPVFRGPQSPLTGTEFPHHPETGVGDGLVWGGGRRDVLLTGQACLGGRPVGN